MVKLTKTIRARPSLSNIFLILALLGLFTFGATHAMSLLEGKLPLTGAWKERFKDVQKFNDYAKSHRVELSGHNIENGNIDGAILTNAKFENNNWKEVSIKKATITKTLFRQGIIENVDFSNSILTDVVFEDVKLRGLRFFHATLHNVKFIRCTFNGINIDQTKNSNIEVNDSKAISTSFSEGQLIAVFRNSKLFDGVELTDLIPPSSLTFEKSELDKVNLSRSVLNELVLDSVKSNRSGFITGEVKKVVLTGENISFGLSEMKIDQLIARKVNMLGIALDDSVLGSFTINDCGGTDSLNLYRTKVDKIEITRCPLVNFAPVASTIGLLHIKDSPLSNSELKRMKVKTFILENVTLDGTLDFTDAQIGELKTNNVTKQPGLKLITTGSNVKF